ncbi:ankyrin [Xylariaceae sp. FL0255]|nr:ankyrin [Xylariaceae sp. FL0255]
MNERRREQNREAQRRFRERQQKRSANDSHILPFLQESGNDQHLVLTPASIGENGEIGYPDSAGDPTPDLPADHSATLFTPNPLLDNSNFLFSDQIFSAALGTPMSMSLGLDSPNKVDGVLANTTSPPEPNSQRRKVGQLTPLHLAAQKGRCTIGRSLLQHRADPNMKDRKGFTPLLHATIQGHDEMITLLLEHGAHIECVDNKSRSALHLAVMHQRRDSLRILLEHCRGNLALIDGYDKKGRTPLHIAIEADFDAGVRTLLQHGANVHCTAQDMDSADDGST